MIKNIIFDFDGVILDSLPIKDFGFQEIFKEFPKEQVDKLIDFHKRNGGWSRFVKIRYFYENILKREISDDEVLRYAEKFSNVVVKELTNKKYLISETIKFLESNFGRYNLHVASGAEENELKYIAKELDVAKYFISINGSPTRKIVLVENILKKNRYSKNETILIGDSINDYEASHENGIEFFGFNNLELSKFRYISNFQDFEKELETI